MKVHHMIAWTALAGLLVIGPLTMTRADQTPSSGLANFPLPGSSGTPMVSSATGAGGNGSVLSIDLRTRGLTAEILDAALETFHPQHVGFVIKRLHGLNDYIVVTIPGSSTAALIQIDEPQRPKLVAHLLRYLSATGTGVIYCPKAPERPTVLVTGAYEDGLDPQGMANAADAGALLFAGGLTF